MKFSTFSKLAIPVVILCVAAAGWLAFLALRTTDVAEDPFALTRLSFDAITIDGVKLGDNISKIRGKRLDTDALNRMAGPYGGQVVATQDAIFSADQHGLIYGIAFGDKTSKALHIDNGSDVERVFGKAEKTVGYPVSAKVKQTITYSYQAGHLEVDWRSGPDAVTSVVITNSPR